MSQYNIAFDQKNGLLAPDTDIVLSFVQEEFKKAFGNDINLDPASPQGQLITSLAAMLVTKNTEFLKLANQFNPLTAQGIFQEALGRIYFLQRKIAQPTVVFCACKGLAGTVIPENALVESVDGVRFYSSGSHVIGTDKSVTIEFLCTEKGAVEVKAHAVQKIVTVIPGWDSVDNENAGISGRIEETQAEFERRRFASVAKNAHGTVASLYGALADIEEVIDLVVLENRGNEPIEEAGVTILGHSVYISIVGGTDSEIANVIYHKLGCGCGTTGNVKITHIAEDFHNAVYKYRINRPQELDLYINVTIKQTETTPATVVEDVQNAILQSFEGLDSPSASRVKMAENLYVSRFYPAILAQGVQEILSIEISQDTANFDTMLFIPADKFPVLKKENIAVTLIKSA